MDYCSICLEGDVKLFSTPRIRTRSSRNTSRSNTTETLEAAWIVNCADSVCKLLDLDNVTFKDFFVSGLQCSACKELLYDIDFTTRSAEALSKRLSSLQFKIAKLLHKTIQSWNLSSNSPAEAEELESLKVINQHEQFKVESDNLCDLNTELEDESEVSLPHSSDVDMKSLQSDLSLSQNWYCPNGSADLKNPMTPSTDRNAAHLGIESTCIPANCNDITNLDLTGRELRMHQPTRYSTRIRKIVSYRDSMDMEDDTKSEDGNESVDYVSYGNLTPRTMERASMKRKRTSASPRSAVVNKRSMHGEFSDTSCAPTPVIVVKGEPTVSDSEYDFTQVKKGVADCTDSEDEVQQPKISSKRCSGQGSFVRKSLRSGSEADLAATTTNLKPVAKDKALEYSSPLEGRVVVTPQSEVYRRHFNAIHLQTQDKSLEATVRFLTQLEKEEVSKNYTYVCPTVGCDERFVDLRHLRQHSLKAHSDFMFLRQFQCTFCLQRFTHDYQLDAHIIRIHQEQKYGYICPVPECPKRIKTHTKFLLHLAKSHADVDMPLPGQELGKQNRLIYRDKSIIGTEDARFSDSVQKRKAAVRSTVTSLRGGAQCYCKVEGCTYRSSSQANMDFHFQKVHASNPFPVKCTEPGCTKTFKNRESGYRRHMVLIHKVTTHTTAVTCLFCPFQCLGKGMLNSHMRKTHAKVEGPKYYCKMCNLLYFTQEECEKHEGLHTDKTGLDCVISNCDSKGFATKEELKEHAKQHDASIRKTIVCDICGLEMTALNYVLKTHLRTHTSELPYKCNYCDKSFRNTLNRSNHEEIIHRDKLLNPQIYKCKLCDETFKARAYLHKHTSWHKHGSNANLPLAKKKFPPKN